MSLRSYELAADGSDFDEVWVNEMAVSQGRILNTSINPMKNSDYIFWRVGDVYYAQNGRTGVVTSNAACHTLVNGLLATNKSYYFVGDTTYILTGAINLADYWSISIKGNPMRGTWFRPADTINAFELDENWYCRLEDFKILGTDQVTSGAGLMFTEATATNYAFRNQIKNIEFRECYEGIRDLGTNTNAGAANLFQDITLYDSTSTDINLFINGTGFWRFVRVTIDHIGAVCSDSYSFRITGADGLVLDTVSMLMGGATSKGGMHIEDTDFIWSNNLDIEKSGLSGVVFKNCRYGQISNLRMHESSMDGAATGESNLALLAVRDFSFTNPSLNISTGATNPLLHIYVSGATQSDHITFNGGHISNGAGYGAVLSDASTNIKLLGMNLYSNANDDIFEEDTTNYNTYKHNNMNSGNGWTLIGANNTYDLTVLSPELDLTGGATDVPIFFAGTDCVIANYRIFYTVATGGGAGVDIRVGMASDGVALDDDYFDISGSELNEGIGHEAFFNTAALTLQNIDAGEILYVGTAGGKADTGKVMLEFNLIENAS